MVLWEYTSPEKMLFTDNTYMLFSIFIILPSFRFLADDTSTPYNIKRSVIYPLIVYILFLSLVNSSRAQLKYKIKNKVFL